MLKLNFIGKLLKDWSKITLETGTVEYVLRVSVVEEYLNKTTGELKKRANVLALTVWRKVENVTDFEDKLKPGTAVYGSCNMPSAMLGKNEKTNEMYGYFSSRQVRHLEFLGVEMESNFLHLQAIGGVTADATSKAMKDNAKQSVINFSIACSERIPGKTDENGYPTRNTIFLNCGMFRDTEKISIVPYLTKSTKLYIEGNPVIRVASNAKGETNAYFNVEVSNIEFVGGTKKETNETGGATAASLQPDDNDLQF